jgi:hypothetical protein
MKKVAQELDKSRIGLKDTSAFTSLIGELSACKRLRLKWEPSKGYDARKGNKKYQIKSRRSSKGEKVDPAGRLGRFSKKEKYNFDYGVLVLLDKKFEMYDCIKYAKKTIKRLEKKKDQQGKGLHVGDFLRRRSN